METKFLQGLNGFFSVAALVMAIFVTPQLASAAQSDEYDGTKYFVAEAGLVGAVVAGEMGKYDSNLHQYRIPVGGESAIKLMQERWSGYAVHDGHVMAKVRLNAERIRQIEKHVLASKPDTLSLIGEDSRFSTKIYYDKFDRPINMKEVRATLKRAKASKMPISKVALTGGRGNLNLYYQSPSIPPKRYHVARKLSTTAAKLSALPLTAWLIDKGTQAAGIPQSRKGYVADRFEKALDTVVGKFSSDNSGRTGAEAAN